MNVPFPMPSSDPRATRGAAIGSSSPNGGDGVIRGTIFRPLDKRMRTTRGGSGTEDMLLVIPSGYD